MNCIRCGTSFDPSSGRCPDCQWNPNARQKPLAGYLVGERVNDRFAVLEAIGMGRLGAVVKAKDLKTNKAVALKVIHPALIPDEDAGARFLACMRAQQTSEYSGISKLIEVGHDAKNYYLARELLYGVTFQQLLEDQQICGQPFPLEEAVEILQQIARILTAARGEAHGTFSPSKIWVLDQRVQIVDFGLASYLPRDAVWHCMRRNGNRFLAPEYIDNRPPDPAGDVYALGVMLGEMLSLAEFDGRAEVFRESEPDLPVEIEALLRCALSQDVDVRYANATELVAALYDVTGFQRTMTMPPDNTNVVPSRFLNTLRSMSEIPASPDAGGDTQKDAVIPPESPHEDVMAGAEEREVITRQVSMQELIEESSVENELDFLDDIQPELIDGDGDEDELDDEPRIPSVPAITPPPYRPSSVGALDPKAARPPRPPGPPGPMRPPRPGSLPPPSASRTAVPLPKPSVAPPKRGTSGLEVKPPVATSPPAVDRARDAAEEEPPYEKFEGINPRFLRAAAKLEKARISEVVEAPLKAPELEEDEEDWRAKLEASTSGSVISFLPPTTTEKSGDVQGFPRNQNGVRQSQLPMAPSGKKKPPPVPSRRK